ncbi:cation transporter [Ureibacillus massiliensis 4400831 = CIP 108448 = CCUG 49529]|uniref:Cation transporter n=2 Tax=cellular organisms TaxID=131567 RepID=A0A0A3JQL0_9BACL|nr:cation diffusion facilitator family transporter [Ureibacillus massiliensis]KGR89277.1 cation transporter [Ureibacillus massiliensis 4400831 = CIP 108448 = CCUG 49529]BDH63556.1 cadmium, cobalt and zinc/H(+)-K(+) antiporter [Lysinibacillus sp. PLM2]
MGHNHTHGGNKKTLTIAFIIITGYMFVEAIGGILTNSLALLSDAGHMLSDSISLAIALVAFRLGEKASNNKKTYGYKRFEVLAAVINGITLILIALYIFYEAIQRFIAPPEVASTGMLMISIVGLLINILVAWIMLRGGDTKENLNLRAAFLHVMSDMLGSVAAIIAAILIMLFNWGWADPIASVIVAVLVFVSGIRVTNSAIHILMEGTPTNIDLNVIIKIFEKVEGVKNIHDLHVWTITSGQHALSCHAVVDGGLTINDSQKILRLIEHELEHQGIGHVTIQLESNKNSHENSILCKVENGNHDHNHEH